MGLVLERVLIFNQVLFLSLSKTHANVASSLRAPSDKPRGPKSHPLVAATLRPESSRVLRLPPGSRESPRARNTSTIRAESLRRDRHIFKNPRKIQGFLALWHPRGVGRGAKREENTGVCVLFAPRSLTKRPPEGEEHKTFE